MCNGGYMNVSERWHPVRIEYRKAAPWVVRAWFYQILVSLPAVGATLFSLWMMFHYQHSPTMMVFCLPAAVWALINLWQVIKIALDVDR